MKMIGHDHFICHSYCHFSVLSHILLSDITIEGVETGEPTEAVYEAYAKARG